MAKNDFKPFATGAGANVMTQVDWEALPALLTGFQSGKASSAQMNKAFRQASVIASMVAQFTADKSGQDVLDNGNITTILNNFIVAISKTRGLQTFTSSGSWTCPANVTTVYVSGCGGGGGGGGGGGSPGAGASSGAGGGGGAGASAMKRPVTVVPGTVYTITIGAGGIGGNGGAIGASGSDGTDGGNTSFGALLTLTGGGRGFGGGGVNPSNLGGGFGGSYGGGGGGSGLSSSIVYPVGGTGGASPFGTPGGATRNGTSSGSGVVTGTPGYGYGAGGGGGGGQTNSTGGIGSQGQIGLPGLLIVEW